MGETHGASYKIHDVVGKGLGMIATRDLFPGELIFAETPILHVDLDPRRNPQLYMSAQFREASEKLVSLGKQFGHLEGAAKYPAEAGVALDQHASLAAEHEFAKLSFASQAKVMALADAFVLRPQARVTVANLPDNVGMLNGTIGTLSGYSRETGMWEVSFSSSTSDRKSVKAENLFGLAGQPMSEKKSVGGIFRTNALLGMSICENLCRINHSCRPNAMWQCVETADDMRFAQRLARGFAELADERAPHIRMGDHLLFATSEISAGSEILISYFPDDAECPTSDRKESLKRYNFVCTCEACSGGIARTIVTQFIGSWATVVLLFLLMVLLATFGFSLRRASAEL